jgi:Ser/Thr protein kinase RdoA (MazF antagonist)
LVGYRPALELQSAQGKWMTEDIFPHNLLVYWEIGPIRSLTEQPRWESASGNVTFVETESGARYVLKRKTVRHTLPHEYKLLETLAAQGVPVAVPLRARSGEPYVQMGEDWFDLSPHIPGTVYNDHYAPGAAERARQFGAAIARLHAALRICEHLNSVPEMDLPADIVRSGQVLRSIWPAAQPSIDPILAELEAGLAACFAELPKQLIHRDAHPGNMLFQDGQLSGWLDFEIMLRGPRLFDLCYCSTSLLINGFGDPNKRQVWFTLLFALVEGYESVSPLTSVERRALRVMQMSIEVIFIAFFDSIHYPAGVAQNIAALTWLYANPYEL